MDEWRVPQHIIERVRTYDIEGSDRELHDLIQEMADQGAIVTSDFGNRRYGAFYLRTTQDGFVVDLIVDPNLQTWCRECFNTELVYDDDGNSVLCPECQE